MIYPFSYKRPYKNYYPSYTPFGISRIPLNSISSDIPIKNSKTSKEETVSRDFVKKEKEKLDYFEILGFKLYYDDLIIIGLILLLLTEGVNDQFLIISLVLLIGD